MFDDSPLFTSRLTCAIVLPSLVAFLLHFQTEDRADESTALRQRVAALTDENRALEARLQILQVKLDDKDVRVKENLLDTVNKDEKIQQLQVSSYVSIWRHFCF